MMRAPSNVLQSLLAKLPVGFALGKRGGVLDTLLRTVAVEISDAEASAASLMDEIDPRRAVALLPDFERVLGPDPCGRDLVPMTLEERQQLAYQRWTARGGQSIPYMLSVAGKLDLTVTIKDFWPTRADRARAGQRLRPEGSQFTWLVVFPEGSPTQATLFALCELRRIGPAHMHLAVMPPSYLALS